MQEEKLLELDLSKAVNEGQILAFQEKVKQINEKIISRTVEEKEWLGWLDLPNKIDSNEIETMHNIVKKWQLQNIEILVVIGIGGSYLGAKAGYEFIYGPYSQNKPKIELLFAGNSLSAEQLVNQLKYVENKKFAINIISKSGTTLEPSIAFREFRKLLESKVGVAQAKDLIVATTDAKKGILYELANTKNYQKFIIPDNVGGRFSVLSPVGLFPFLCAGMKIEDILKGAQEANKNADDPNLKTNLAYRYAVTRNILSQSLQAEMMVNYEPKMFYFSEWWKQLFAESEGKNGKGLFPLNSTFSTDLHSLGQMIQEGKKFLFETVLLVKKTNSDLILKAEKEDLDHLKYLDGKTVHKVNWTAFKGTLEAHSITANIPNIVIYFDKFNEFTLGFLFQFFERALAMSAYLLDVNPFNQPGVEIYKSNMFRMLKDK